MIKKVKAWIADPSRRYAEGLAIFKEYASESIRKKYSGFLQLKSDDEEVKSFDPRFPVLINKMVAILEMMKINPGKYTVQPAAGKQEKSVREEILEKSRIIRELKAEKETLQSTIKDLEESGDEKQEEIDDLTSELEEKDGKIESLEEDLQEKLSSSGLKVVRYDDLPADVKKLYDRTKEIVPLMARIHSELSIHGISDDDRRAKAAELCRLDDERRSIWDRIDAWSEGKDFVPDVPKEFAYSEDPVVKGMQISKRIARLEENISRTRKAIEGHIRSKKANLEAKARKRLSAFEKELSGLQALVDNE
ncbi:MAG: hypothetical protein LBC40_05925 [Dysgonamonadaceae bacterium]|jgi:flagellar motility protein MotE (MotC chaperone)|nr:hypothetical protein [Dysgonamonadaceae bacterium]